jgi:hypothetical protein
VSDGDALLPRPRRRPRENVDGVDGGRQREDTGPCQAGSGCGGDARRVARGSGGGGVRRRRTWPGRVHGRAHDVVGMVLG